MSTAGFVLVCALDLLGRSTASLPPIVILDHRPPDATAHAAAFVRPGENIIYLIAASAPFRMAVESGRNPRDCFGLDAMRLVASIIVHEEWHLKHGPDEEGAYLAQLTELQRLGAGPGRWPYESVRRALVITKATAARRLLAARDQVARTR